ncbi:MAG: hypothetical protein WCZ47_00635 [Bacilli bacterium]|jgi:hypothetical protein|nr:hypothetical protein [Bacilli bacterium]NLN80734.1 hypothetical protein [Erysipelotrichia bacterium]
MRKSVVLIISTISLLAIIAIGLIFQRAKIYDETVYIEEIIVKSVKIGDDFFETYYYDHETDYGYRVKDPNKDHNAQFAIPYQENLTMLIIYEVKPETSTNKNVTFHTTIHDDIERQIATVERDSGLVTFLQDGTASFDLRAVDNPATTTKIKIRTKDFSFD